MLPAPWLLAFASAWVALAASLLACGSTTTTTTGDGGVSPPVQGTYTIIFPSLSVAVATDKVEVRVFDASEATTQCLDLIQAQKGGGTLPASLVPTQAISPCSLESGVGNLAVPFGSYAVLIVAQRAGTDLAIGCAPQTISASHPTVTVPLEVVAGQSVAPTTCTKLSSFCGNQCH